MGQSSLQSNDCRHGDHRCRPQRGLGVIEGKHVRRVGTPRSTSKRASKSFGEAVAEDFATAEGRAAARGALQAKFNVSKMDALKDTALAELRDTASILDAKAPEDAAAFKSWLQAVAQKAAEAGIEGGFLGFGGVAVSEAEKATLGEISTALKS